MFGGSFDPVHNDHVGICETMIKEAELDKVVVFPAACSPFKNNTQADDIHRLNMCKLAFSSFDKVEVCDFEINKGGKSYTIDTLNFLKEKYPAAKLYLIVGADAFLTLSNWYKADEIFSLAHILTVVRDDTDYESLELKAKEYNADCTLISTPIGFLSSTTVRKALAKKQNVSECLSPQVINYIKENGLYGYADK